MKPVQFPTRRSIIREMFGYIYKNEPAFVAALILGLFAIVGLGAALTMLVDQIVAAWGAQ